MLEVRYCPICMNELLAQTAQTHWCPYCKALFYIVMTLDIDSPVLRREDE